MKNLLFFLLVLFPVITEAQFSAPGMSAVRYTTYSSPGDPVFIYCNSSGTQKGSLNVAPRGGSAPYSYTWFKWNDSNKKFDILIPQASGDTPSTRNNLDEGGYKVRIKDLYGYTDSLNAWIFTDKPYSSALLQNRTCDYVALKGKAAVDTFYYYNPANGNRISLPNGVKYYWSSNPTSSIPCPDCNISPKTYNPPLDNVTYMLKVTDSLGCASESSFYYESIHVNADFSVSPNKGEAPLEVSFTDKSVRGNIYKWEFGDTTTSTLANPEPHVYYKPGEYSVKLTIESSLHCIDSVRFDKIVVDPSELGIPNVFTPDGDGINDYFAVESKSLRYINVEIFSRSGMKVYTFHGEGESLRVWKGWDGYVNNSSSKATPGVYFYIIHAFGWDDIDYNSKEQRGFVYLYR